MICSLICKIVYRFGEEIVEKMRDWAVEYVPRVASLASSTWAQGTGISCSLYQKRATTMNCSLGIDYSMDAVRLAQSIASTRNAEGGEVCLCRFFYTKISSYISSRRGTDKSRSASEQWDLVLDKGTYDAIALSEKKDDDSGPSPLEMYTSKAAGLVLPGGVFMITCRSPSDVFVAIPDANIHRSLQFHGRRAPQCISEAGVGSFVPVRPVPKHQCPLAKTNCLLAVPHQASNPNIWGRAGEYLILR